MGSKNTAVAVADEKTKAIGPVIDYSNDAGAGMEGADASTFAIPFITILQGLSPQLKTVEGAKPGLFINTITNEMFSEVLVIPCAFRRRFLRWAPNRGGFKGEYNPLEVETGKVPGMSKHDNMYLMDVPAGITAVFDPKGRPLYDHLADTRMHFVLACTKAGAWQPALVSLASTQIKKSKRWMSRIQGIEMRKPDGSAFNPPSFSHMYALKAIEEKNQQGEWWGYDIHLVGPVEGAELYAKAKAFHASVVAGQVEVAQPQPDAEAGADNNGGKF